MRYQIVSISGSQSVYVLYCTVPDSIISVQLNSVVSNAFILESAVRGIYALELLFLLVVGIEVALHFSFRTVLPSAKHKAI